MKNKLIIAILFCFPSISFCQFPGFSISTDIGIQRNFKKDQRFWAFGHTTHAQFHLSRTDGIYVWFAYYSAGKFHNDVLATAKDPLTVPQQIAYRNNAKLRLRQFSTGWKRYLKGGADMEKGWSLYGYAGLGLLLGRVENTHSVSIDTADYFLPVRKGKGNFKRLTLDLGLGVEFPIGNDFYFYSEARAWIPTTDYPSDYLFVNNKAPFTGMFGSGLRILF